TADGRSPPTRQSASAATSATAGNSGWICKANTTSRSSNASAAWKSRVAFGRQMQREYGSPNPNPTTTSAFWKSPYEDHVAALGQSTSVPPTDPRRSILARGAAGVDDRDIVGINAAPARQPVEQGHRRRGRHQQSRFDTVLVKQPQEIGEIFQVHGTVVAQHERLAVEFRPAVDEGCNSDKIEIAAQGI